MYINLTNPMTDSISLNDYTPPFTHKSYSEMSPPICCQKTCSFFVCARREQNLVKPLLSLLKKKKCCIFHCYMLKKITRVWGNSHKTSNVSLLANGVHQSEQWEPLEKHGVWEPQSKPLWRWSMDKVEQRRSRSVWVEFLCRWWMNALCSACRGCISLCSLQDGEISYC